MKIKISNKTAFLKAVNDCSRAVSTKSTMPILADLLIEVKDNVATIFGSDLENTVVKKIAIESDGNEPFCVDAKKFKDALASITSETLDINVSDSGLTIKHKSGKMSLPVDKATEYPKPKHHADAMTISINSSIICGLYSDAIKFTATDDLRPVMCGIYTYCNNGMFGVCATDAQKLYTNSLPKECDNEFDFTAPFKFANFILDAYRNECTLRMFISDKDVAITDGETTIISRKIEGKFPNFNSVIPKQHDVNCVVDKNALTDAVKRCSILGGALSVLDITSDMMHVNAENIDFATSSSDDVECKSNGDIKIGVKGVNLISVMSVLSSDSITLNMGTPARAMVLSDGNDRKVVLLMPMVVS